MMELGLMLADVQCGQMTIAAIVPNFTSALVTAVKIFIPIVLIAYGMIDLAKAVTANDDKVMKEAQSKLIKRIVYAVLIFFVVAIVQAVFSVLGSAGEESEGDIKGCISCFMNGSDDASCSHPRAGE